MILRWPSFSPTRKPSSPTRNSNTTTCNSLKLRSNSIHQWKLEESKNNSKESSSSSCSNNSFCLCGRRRFLETAATSLSLLPIYPSNATDLHPDDPMVPLSSPNSCTAIKIILGFKCICMSGGIHSRQELAQIYTINSKIWPRLDLIQFKTKPEPKLCRFNISIV